MSRVPSPERVARSLADIGGEAAAVQLHRRLLQEGYGISEAQLGIQRATDAGAVIIGRDWNLRLPERYSGVIQEAKP